MAKLLKHLGIGVKKTGASSHRSDYNAQKSNSVHELLPKSPTRYRSSTSLTTANQEYDTHSLKLFTTVDGNHRTSASTNGRHGAGTSGRNKEQKSLSPKGNTSNDTYYTAIESTLTEEKEVFDSPPNTSSTAQPPSNTATPPRLLDEYCDPLDLKKMLAESADLLGAIGPTPSMEDDYSVPYEVKKILKGIRPKERGLSASMERGCHLNGSLSRGSTSLSASEAANGCMMDESFDEPWEWSAKLSAIVAQNPSVYNPNSCLTPMMTPKKMVQSNKTEKELAASAGDHGNDVHRADISDLKTAAAAVSQTSSDEQEEQEEEEESDGEVDYGKGRASALQRSGITTVQLQTPDALVEAQSENKSLRDPLISGASSTKLGVIVPERHERLSSIDSSSGGSLIITEIPPIVDVEPYDCQIIIRQVGYYRDSNPNRCSSSSEALSTYSAEDDRAAVVIDDDSKMEMKSFQNVAHVNKEKEPLVNVAVASELLATSSGALSGVPRKSNHEKQTMRLHLIDSSQQKANKSENKTNVLSTSSAKEKAYQEIALEQQCWYHGQIGRIEAEELLQPEKEGSFLVRMSESNKEDFSLSLKSGRGFLHMKIVNCEGQFILGQFSQPFDSIPRMIDFFCMSKLPIKGNENISLIHPLVHDDSSS